MSQLATQKSIDSKILSQQKLLNTLKEKEEKTLAEKVIERFLELGGKLDLQRLYKAMNATGDMKNYIRSVIYRNLESFKEDKTKAKFRRVGEKGEGVYELSPHVFMAVNAKTESSTLIVKGDGRNMDMVKDSSVDAIVTDHPWEDRKAHRAGNQKNFTEDYENATFKYEVTDIRNKYRVLKDGHFCVEILPQKSGTNAKYLRKIEEMFEAEGFEFFAECNWVKGELKPIKLANGETVEALETAQIYTGRTIKDNSKVLFFTKGKCRKLRPYKAKIKKVFNKLLKQDKTVKDILEEILEPGSYKKVKSNSFTKAKISDIDYNDFSSTLNKGLKDKFLKDEYCMSGAREILPSRFIYPAINPKEKIHQAEKPLGLYEAIIDLITKAGEVVLDQFAGGGGVGEAAMNIGRSAFLIELLDKNVKKICKRLNGFDITDIIYSKPEQQKRIIPQKVKVSYLSPERGAQLSLF
ncbi:MAG: DNA methyltransferase [bacterium]